MGDAIRITLHDREQAVDTYLSGLRHGLLTAQISPPPPSGSRCRVELELAFARLVFPLQGDVVHSGTVATVIRVDAVPDKLHQMLGGKPPERQSTSTPTTLSRDVRELGPTPTPLGTSDEMELPSSQTASRASASSAGRSPTPGSGGSQSPSSGTARRGSTGRSADYDEPSIGNYPPDSLDSWDEIGPHTVTRDGSLDDEDSMPQVGERTRPAPTRRRDREPPDLSSSPSFRMGRPKRPKNYLAERLRRSSLDRRSAGRTSDRPGGRGSSEAPSPRVHGRPPDAQPMPARTASGPGIPVPYQPNRYLPAIAKIEGSLGETSAYEMLLRVYDAMLTGVGVIDLPHERYWVYLLNGKPVHYLREPDLQSESTEALLIRKKLLSQPVLDWARWLAEVTAQPLVSVVMRLKLITEGQLHSLRTTQVKMITRRVLDQRQGSYRFYEAPDVRRVFRNPAVTVTEMLWKRASFSYANLNEAQIEAQLEKMIHREVGLTPLGSSVLEQFPLSAEQRELVQRHIVPGRPVQSLFADAAMQRREIVELLLGLRLMGLVRFTRHHRGADPEAARLGRMLREQYKRTDRDLFGFLELHWAALPDEIEHACERIEGNLEEAAQAAAFIRDFDRMTARIRARLEQARELVVNKRRRREYRERQVGEAERTMAAEMYLKQAEMAMFRDEHDEARECFERMLEIDPGGPGSRDRRDRATVALEELRGGRNGRRRD